MSTVYTVRSKRFDGRLKRSWTGELVERSPEYLVLRGVFEAAVDHSAIGHIAKGTISYEYFWPGKWYNVFRFHDPAGAFLNYYCNIGLPPEISENAVDYIDLDIDILINPGGAVTILDEDEFEQNSVEMNYSSSVIAEAKSAVDSLLKMIRNREFPFGAEI